MYLLQRGTSNTTAQEPFALLNENISATSEKLWPKTRDFILKHLQTALRWTSRHIVQAKAALWQFSHISQGLHFLGRLLFVILQGLGIVLAGLAAVIFVARLGRWGLPKILKVYRKRKVRLHVERQALEWEEQRAAKVRVQQARWVAEEDARVKARVRQAREKEEFMRALRARQAREEEDMREGRARQIREAQTLRETTAREEEGKQFKIRADFGRWERECEGLFRDKTVMTRFPFPPLLRCLNPNCLEFLGTCPVPVCQHNVKQFFEGSGKFSVEFLKHQRQLWHPDRFSSCQMNLRNEFEGLANSLFIVLDPWYEALQAQQTRSSG